MSDAKNKRIQKMQLDEFVVEEGMDEQLNSPNMRPYLELAMTAAKGQNLSASLVCFLFGKSLQVRLDTKSVVIPECPFQRRYDTPTVALFQLQPGNLLQNPAIS